MKKLLFFLFICCGVQAQEPWGRVTTKGTFVHFNQKRWLGKPVEVFVLRPGEQGFRSLARINPPESALALSQNIAKAKSLFYGSNLKPPTADEWAKYSAKDPQFAAAVSLHPELSLVFGLAFMDTEGTGKYKLKCGTEEIEVKSERNGFPSLRLDSTLVWDQAIGLHLHFPYVWKDLVRFEVSRKTVSQRNEDYKKIPAAPLLRKDNSVLVVDSTLGYMGAYDYRIGLSDVFGDSDSLKYTFQANNIPFSLVSEVQDVRIQSGAQQRSLDLTWTIAAPEYVQSMTLYRSTKYDSAYAPVAILSPKDKQFIDHVEVANELYFYYFEIRSVFGVTRKSRHYLAMYDGKEMPTPPRDVVLEARGSQPQVSWSTNDKITRGFYVFRREGAEGDWFQISPLLPNRLGGGTFKDTSALDPAYNYFYAVKSESDTYRQSDFSEEVFFSTRSVLKPPYDIHIGINDHTVQLRWERTDPGVGYHVFRKTKDKFEQITAAPLTLNAFTDTLKYDTALLTYAIASVNVYGDRSPLSLPVHLEVPLALVPDALGYERDTKGLLVKWTNFDSPAIKQIKVLRAENDGPVQVIATLTSTDRTFRDTKTAKGKTYTYQVRTFSQTGQEFESPLLTIAL